MTKIRKPLMTPELPDLLRMFRDEIFSNLNCVKVGKIQSFDGTKKTAQVQVMFKRVVGDQITSYPLLVDCPIFTLQGGGGAVYMPIAAGNPCLVLFADRNIDAWYSTGSEAAPNTPRCHDLSDGIAFVGIEPLTTTLAAYPANEARMTYSGARLGLKGGKANIQNATVNLIDALEKLVQGIQGMTYINSGGTPTVLVDATTKVAGALTDLKALLYKD